MQKLCQTCPQSNKSGVNKPRVQKLCHQRRSTKATNKIRPQIRCHHIMLRQHVTKIGQQTWRQQLMCQPTLSSISDNTHLLCSLFVTSEGMLNTWIGFTATRGNTGGYHRVHGPRIPGSFLLGSSTANHLNKFFNYVCKHIGQQQLTHQESACHASQPRQHNI